MSAIVDLIQCAALIALAFSALKQGEVVGAMRRQVESLEDRASMMRIWLSALNRLVGVKSGPGENVLEK